MKLTHEDQIIYAKLALRILDAEYPNEKNVALLYEFSELMKEHADTNNFLLFDVTEYIYETLREIRGDSRAFADKDQRAEIEKDLAFTGKFS